MHCPFCTALRQQYTIKFLAQQHQQHLKLVLSLNQKCRNSHIRRSSNFNQTEKLALLKFTWELLLVYCRSVPRQWFIHLFAVRLRRTCAFLQTILLTTTNQFEFNMYTKKGVETAPCCIKEKVSWCVLVLKDNSFYIMALICFIRQIFA